MKFGLKSKKFRILFVISSFSAFFILSLFYVALFYAPAGQPPADFKAASEDRYFFKDSYYEDPYATRHPDLKDMIKGPIITSADPFLGDSDAEIVITVFSDFTCPFCKSQEEILREIIEENPGLRLSRKDYPEASGESFSFRAALAARCAFSQDKFWEYHDELYLRELDHSINNEEIIRKELTAAAEAAGLSLPVFKECYENDSAKQAVLDNMEEADALGISGIPYIYINDQGVMGSMSKEGIMRMVDMVR